MINDFLCMPSRHGVTKWAEGHIGVALSQMVLCFRMARVTWEAVCCGEDKVRYEK